MLRLEADDSGDEDLSTRKGLARMERSKTFLQWGKTQDLEVNLNERKEAKQ